MCVQGTKEIKWWVEKILPDINSNHLIQDSKNCAVLQSECLNAMKIWQILLCIVQDGELLNNGGTTEKGILWGENVRVKYSM